MSTPEETVRQKTKRIKEDMLKKARKLKARMNEAENDAREKTREMLIKQGLDPAENQEIIETAAKAAVLEVKGNNQEARKYIILLSEELKQAKVKKQKNG